MEKEIKILGGTIVCGYCGIDCELFHVSILTHYGAKSYHTNEIMCKKCIKRQEITNEED